MTWALKKYEDRIAPIRQLRLPKNPEKPTMISNSIPVLTVFLGILGHCDRLPLSTVFLQPVELVTTCTLTMLGALEVVRAAYCALSCSSTSRGCQQQNITS